MAAHNTGFSTLKKRKNVKMTGLYFREWGKGTRYHCLVEMFCKLDPRSHPSTTGNTKSLDEDVPLNPASGALFSWPGDVALVS